jgi:pilus assembly protein CpaB
MSVRQLIVLGVALLAAIGALVFVQGVARSRPQVEAAPKSQTEGPRVLVAARELMAGARLSAGDLEWRPWAADAVAEGFVTDAEAGDAEAKFVEEGRIVRQTMVAGEPVVEERMIKPGTQGFMAAMISPGYRAVAVPISEETAASGFILPNDRVDVITTRKMTLTEIGSTAGSEITRSGVVLQNVRVLAVDQTYKTEKDDEGEPVKGSVALLELSPRDTELLAMADQMGEISLALRPIDAETRGEADSARRTADVLDQFARGGAGVKIHAFGAVRQASGQGGQP